MPDEPKTVFLHVGCRKSGTTALQMTLHRSAAGLVEAGLAQPLLGRGPALRKLVEPLRRAVDGDADEAGAAVARLARLIRDSEHPRHLLTIEALAELPPEVTSLVVKGLSEFDTRVVVTVRPWALTIPSEWQQRVKVRFTGDFLHYARAVRCPADATDQMAAEAAHFRRRQDVGDVVRRWRAADPELPVHVILVPHDRRARPSLQDLFCQVVGIDVETLIIPRRGTNPSLTREDAEVLRRLNLALGNRLGNVRGNYKRSVRKWIAVRVMMKESRGSRIRLPSELDEWASAEAARQLTELEEMGCEVLGNPAGFERPALPDGDYAPVTEAEVAEASLALLADLAHGHARQRRRARAQARKRKSARTRRRQGAENQLPGPDLPLIRRKLRSLRRRVDRLPRR